MTLVLVPALALVLDAVQVLAVELVPGVVLAPVSNIPVTNSLHVCVCVLIYLSIRSRTDITGWTNVNSITIFLSTSFCASSIISTRQQQMRKQINHRTTMSRTARLNHVATSVITPCEDLHTDISRHLLQDDIKSIQLSSSASDLNTYLHNETSHHQSFCCLLSHICHLSSVL